MAMAAAKDAAHKSINHSGCHVLSQTSDAIGLSLSSLPCCLFFFFFSEVLLLPSLWFDYSHFSRLQTDIQTDKFLSVVLIAPTANGIHPLSAIVAEFIGSGSVAQIESLARLLDQV